MRRTVPSAALALVVVMVVGGCGGTGSQTSDAPKETVTATATPSPSTSTSPSTSAPASSAAAEPEPESQPPASSPVASNWGPFKPSSTPGLSIVSSGLERPRPPYEAFSTAGAVAYNNGPEHFSTNVTFQVVKGGFVTQSATALISYVPADSFFATGALLDPVGPDEELKVVFEDGTLVEKSVPATIEVEAISTGDTVPINVTTDTRIPQGAPAYVVYVDDEGQILGGGSASTNVTMEAGATTSDALDTLIAPRGTREVYVTIDRLSMM